MSAPSLGRRSPQFTIAAVIFALYWGAAMVSIAVQPAPGASECGQQRAEAEEAQAEEGRAKDEGLVRLGIPGGQASLG